MGHKTAFLQLLAGSAKNFEGLGEPIRLLAIEHGVAGYLYHLYRQDDWLKREWKRQRQRYVLLNAEMHRLADLCAGRVRPPTILKGMALVGDIYKDPGMRSMSDIDLLVKREDMPGYDQLLREMGYRKLRTRTWSANIFKSTYAKLESGGELIFELHSRLFFQEQKVTWRTQPAAIAGARRLRDEDLLVHLAGHLGYQHTFLKLSWLVDIAELYRCRKSRIDFGIVKRKASAARVYRSLSATAFALERYFNIRIPQCRDLQLNKAWGLRLTEDFLCEPKGNMLRYFQMKHLLKDSPLLALQYNALWALQKLRI